MINFWERVTFSFSCRNFAQCSSSNSMWLLYRKSPRVNKSTVYFF